MKSITACTMDCPDACSLLAWKEKDGTLRIRGNPDHPFTAGFTCAKIHGYPKRLQSPHRILHPLVRKGSRWERISWDAALDLCAERIQACRQRPASILHIHGEGAKGVLKQTCKLFFALLGASRTKGSLCDAAGFIACLNDFGSRLNNAIEDLGHARHIVNWGKDLARSSVHTAAIVRKARSQGTRVLRISPGDLIQDGLSDVHIRIRPGTDRLLAAAVIGLLLEQGRVDPRIWQHTSHTEAFQEALQPHSPSQLAAACQVSPADLEHIYQAYTDEGPTATLIGAGLQRYPYGGENVRFIDALALLSGNVGKQGGGVYFHLHSLGSFNLDWSKGPKTVRRALAMPTIGKGLSEAMDPPIQVLWINGSNVVNQAADTLATLKALQTIPFKVVVDAFMTDTAQAADLFLPTTLMLEQADLIGSYLHNYIHLVEPVVAPPPQARSDVDILCDLGKRLDPPIPLPEAETCFRLALQHPEIPVSLEELKICKFARTLAPAVAYEGLRFDTPDGQYRLPTFLHPEPDHPASFPLRLLSLIRKDAIHSQILPEDQEVPVHVWLSPETAGAVNLDLDNDVWLVSPLGRLKARPHLMPGLHPETVVCRRGTWRNTGGGLNQLIEARLSDMGSGAPFYEAFVRLETVDRD